MMTMIIKKIIEFGLSNKIRDNYNLLSSLYACGSEIRKSFYDLLEKFNGVYEKQRGTQNIFRRFFMNYF
jgi:hypothetical protein